MLTTIWKHATTVLLITQPHAAFVGSAIFQLLLWEKNSLNFNFAYIDGDFCPIKIVSFHRDWKIYFLEIKLDGSVLLRTLYPVSERCDLSMKSQCLKKVNFTPNCYFKMKLVVLTLWAPTNKALLCSLY